MTRFIIAMLIVVGLFILAHAMTGCAEIEEKDRIKFEPLNECVDFNCRINSIG